MKHRGEEGIFSQGKFINLYRYISIEITTDNSTYYYYRLVPFDVIATVYG